MWHSYFQTIHIQSDLSIFVLRLDKDYWSLLSYTNIGFFVEGVTRMFIAHIIFDNKINPWQDLLVKLLMNIFLIYFIFFLIPTLMGKIGKRLIEDKHAFIYYTH